MQGPLGTATPGVLSQFAAPINAGGCQRVVEWTATEISGLAMPHSPRTRGASHHEKPNASPLVAVLNWSFTGANPGQCRAVVSLPSRRTAHPPLCSPAREDTPTGQLTSGTRDTCRRWPASEANNLMRQRTRFPRIWSGTRRLALMSGSSEAIAFHASGFPCSKANNAATELPVSPDPRIYCPCSKLSLCASASRNSITFAFYYMLSRRDGLHFTASFLIGGFIQCLQEF